MKALLSWFLFLLVLVQVPGSIAAEPRCLPILSLLDPEIEIEAKLRAHSSEILSHFQEMVADRSKGAFSVILENQESVSIVTNPNRIQIYKDIHFDIPIRNPKGETIGFALDDIGGMLRLRIRYGENGKAEKIVLQAKDGNKIHEVESPALREFLAELNLHSSIQIRDEKAGAKRKLKGKDPSDTLLNSFLKLVEDANSTDPAVQYARELIRKKYPENDLTFGKFEQVTKGIDTRYYFEFASTEMKNGSARVVIFGSVDQLKMKRLIETPLGWNRKGKIIEVEFEIVNLATTPEEQKYQLGVLSSIARKFATEQNLTPSIGDKAHSAMLYSVYGIPLPSQEITRILVENLATFEKAKGRPNASLKEFVNLAPSLGFKTQKQVEKAFLIASELNNNSLRSLNYLLRSIDEKLKSIGLVLPEERQALAIKFGKEKLSSISEASGIKRRKLEKLLENSFSCLVGGK